MSREVKFRGLSEGKWYNGLLTFMFSSYAIVDPKDENTVHLVDVKTVGQYTGLKDKKGVEIYEGDIISYTMLRFNGVGYETEEEYGVVEYGDAVFEIDGVPLYVAHAEDDEIEIIGNIYENLELLENK